MAHGIGAFVECVGRCAARDLAKKGSLSVPSSLAGHLLDIDVVNGTLAVGSECNFHPLSEQRLVGLTMRPKKVVWPISGALRTIGTTGEAVREWHNTSRAKRARRLSANRDATR